MTWTIESERDRKRLRTTAMIVVFVMAWSAATLLLAMQNQRLWGRLMSTTESDRRLITRLAFENAVLRSVAVDECSDPQPMAVPQ